MSIRSKKKIFKIIVIVVITIIAITISIGMFSVWYVLRPCSGNVNYLQGNMVYTKAFDGVSLAASERYSDEDTHRWALIVHSYRSHKSAMSVYEKKYHKDGYNTLTVDNRAHGQSGGKYIGMGYLDKFDIGCWVDYILEKDPEAEIVMHGLSMGGAAVMMYSGQEVPSNIKAVIEDSGYLSAESYLKWKLKQRFHLPSFPVIPIANAAFKISAGYYMTDASALEGVKNSRIPTLFIHGAEDTTVPVLDAYRLYEEAACPKQIYVVEGAGHGEAVGIDPEGYWDTVEDFIEKAREA